MSIPDGVYAARAISAALGETKGGKPQIAVEFELTDVPDGTRPHRTWYGNFTDATQDRTIESLRVCGWTGDDLTDVQVSADVSLVIETEEYEGKARQKIQWVNRPEGLALAKRMEPNAAKAFAESMKGQIMAFDQRVGKPAPKRQNNQSRGRDDIPPPTDRDGPPV